SGVVRDVIYLDYSQEKLAAYGVVPSQIQNVLSARNTVARGGAMELAGKTVLIAPAGEFKDESDIGGTIVTRGANGAPVYLRDLAQVSRGYENPQYLSYISLKDANGRWQRTRAVALSLTMKSGLQVASFGKAVQEKLARTRGLL